MSKILTIFVSIHTYKDDNMKKLEIAKEIADTYDDIEAITGKEDALKRFAGKLINSQFQHVEVGLEEYDIENRPILQFIPKPIEGDDFTVEPEPMGYQKIFQSPGELNIYSVLVPTNVAMSVVDTLLTKLKAEKTEATKRLNTLLSQGNKDNVYQYTINSKPSK